MMNIDEIFMFLAKAGSAAPSADNMQPWSFNLDEHDFVLRYDSSRFPNAIFPQDHHATRMAMGAVIENLRQATSQLGLSVDFQNKKTDAMSNEFCRFPLLTTLKVDMPKVAALYERHTNRLPYRKDALSAPVVSQLAASRQGEARIIVTDSVSGIERIGDFVKTASKIRFQTKEIHEWFSQSLRFGPEAVRIGNGLDVATFDLPPGGKLLLKAITSSWGAMSAFNRIGGYHIMAATEAMSITKAGAILAIVAPVDAAGAIDSGSLMQRIWLSLNMQGYAVQPYYVVSDQLTRLASGQLSAKDATTIGVLKNEVMKEFDLPDGSSLGMLLRVGVPQRVPKRSLRLPTPPIP